MGRKRKSSNPNDYSKSGQPRRKPLGPTPEMKRLKEKLTGALQYEITPLGILAGRGLISPFQYSAAADFAALHAVVWKDHDMPRSPKGTLSHSASEPGPDDADIAIAKFILEQQGEQRIINAQKHYSSIAAKMGVPRWELLHWIAIYSERCGWMKYGDLGYQIQRADLYWDSEQKMVVARRSDAVIFPSTRAQIISIRSVLQSLIGKGVEDFKPTREIDRNLRIKSRRSSLEEQAARVPRRRGEDNRGPRRRHDGESYNRFNELDHG